MAEFLTSNVSLVPLIYLSIGVIFALILPFAIAIAGLIMLLIARKKKKSTKQAMQLLYIAGGLFGLYVILLLIARTIHY
jgi:hypothetical protein